MSERPGVEESQGLIGRAVDAARTWWGVQNREQKVRTVYRLWVVFLALLVLIVGSMLLHKEKQRKTNKMGREWLETANEAGDTTGRSAIPSSGGPAGGPSAEKSEGPVAPGGVQPGYAPTTKGVQPGQGQPSGGNLKSGSLQPDRSGRAAIPGAGG